MWRRMKKRLYDFFFYETIETIEMIDEEKEKRKQHAPILKNVEMKVKYEYPENKEFRFPLIPDLEEKRVHKNDQTLDIPAYMRNDRMTKKRLVHEEKAKDEVQDVDRPTEESARFVPTDVPSPIYGYQRRKNERMIQNTPAYIRRQMRSEHDQSSAEEIAATTKQFVEEVDFSPTVENENNTYSEQIVDDPHTMKSNVAYEVDHTPFQKKTDEQEIKDVVPQESIEREEKKHEQPKRSSERRASRRTHSSSGDIPFNVMMTRQDKIRYERQQRKQVQQEERMEVPQTKTYDIPMHLLDDPQPTGSTDRRWLREQQHLLEETFVHFNVDATVVNVTQGPSVTRFEVQPALGVKVSKVRNLSDDIKLNLSAKDIRIEAPIPGRNTIGIEIPNAHAQTVGLYEILHGDTFMKSTASLPIGLGVTIEGEPLITDVANMPHGLIAGATGSGKSVCINTILLSLLYHSHYNDVKLLLIDPKMVELTPYNGIPHLVSPVITDVKAATAALQWAVDEMEKRYEQFVEEGVRDIHRFNHKVNVEGRTKEKMPFIVIVIDELADLMMMAPQDVEDSICRIAQKARACGMHLLIATQRPSVDVITGLIKANVPTRIAFSVSSQVDSRTIIDTNGAERLLGKGDMLFIENGSGKSIRLQGAFVSDDEIDRVVQNVKQMSPPQYLFEEEQLLEMTTEMNDDPLLEEVVSFVSEQNSISTSMVQRNFRVGYNRAARLMEALEQRGIISGQNGSKPRDILIRK